MKIHPRLALFRLFRTEQTDLTFFLRLTRVPKSSRPKSKSRCNRDCTSTRVFTPRALTIPHNFTLHTLHTRCVLFVATAIARIKPPSGTRRATPGGRSSDVRSRVRRSAFVSRQAAKVSTRHQSVPVRCPDLPVPSDCLFLSPTQMATKDGSTFFFTSESVNEGHPDKLADQVRPIETRSAPLSICNQTRNADRPFLPASFDRV